MWSRFVLTAVLLSQLVAQLAQSTSANAFGYEEVLVIDDCHCHPVTRDSGEVQLNKLYPPPAE